MPKCVLALFEGGKIREVSVGQSESRMDGK